MIDDWKDKLSPVDLFNTTYGPRPFCDRPVEIGRVISNRNGLLTFIFLTNNSGGVDDFNRHFHRNLNDSANRAAIKRYDCLAARLKAL